MNLSLNELLNGKNAVLFDLDGTLLDSMSLWHDIDVEFLGRYGLAVPDDLMYAIGGMTFREVADYFIDRFNLTESPDEIMGVWNEMAYHKYACEIKLKPGAYNLLTELKERGYPMAIVTSNSENLLFAGLDAQGIRSLFSAFITSETCAKGKPDPEVYLEAAKRLHVQPEECLVFEDIEVGILAGKRAGMTVCAVEDDFSADRREQKRELADHFLDSFLELDLSCI